MTVLIGTTTAPGSADSFLSGECFASSYAATASGNVETITLATTAGQTFASLGLAIYSDSAGSPNTRLGTTGTTSDTSAGNKVLTLGSPVAVVSGTTYWLALLATGGGDVRFNQVSGGSYKGHAAETAFQDPFGSTASVNASNRFPIQGDGTLAGGAVLGPTFTPIPLMGGH